MDINANVDNKFHKKLDVQLLNEIQFLLESFSDVKSYRQTNFKILEIEKRLKSVSNGNARSSTFVITDTQCQW